MDLNKQKKPTLSSTQQQLMRFNLTKRKYGEINEKEEQQQQHSNANNDIQITLGVSMKIL